MTRPRQIIADHVVWVRLARISSPMHTLIARLVAHRRKWSSSSDNNSGVRDKVVYPSRNSFRTEGSSVTS